MLSRKPIGLHGLKSVGLIGSFRMPANGGNVLGILLSIKKKEKKKNFSGKVGKMPVVPTERHIRTK